jgi:cysteine sulfinate desulfinase/cysteine desulfurase-like protein
MGVDDEEISCAIRVSVGISNTFEDVQEFCKVWKTL